MASDLLLGYAGAVVAVFFFGSCYVPAKQYPTYGASSNKWMEECQWTNNKDELLGHATADGIIFQWFMVCCDLLQTS